MRLCEHIITFLLLSIVISVQAEVSPCAGKEINDNLPETRTLNRLGNRRPGLIIKGGLPFGINSSGNVGQIHGSGGFPNGGTGIINGGNKILINNRFLGQSNNSKNNTLSQRLGNLVHKHGLGIRGGNNGNPYQSQQINTGPNSQPSLVGTNNLGGGGNPPYSGQVTPAVGAASGGPTAAIGGTPTHGHRPHHGLHGGSNSIGSGAAGGNLLSHHFSHHGGLGSHSSTQGGGSTGHHHFGHGGAGGISGGMSQIHGHHGGIGFLQGGGAGSVSGGGVGHFGHNAHRPHLGGLGGLSGGLSQIHGHHGGLGLLQGGGAGGGHLGLSSHRPHLGGFGIVHNNAGNQVGVSNHNLVNGGLGTRPTHGGLLGLVQGGHLSGGTNSGNIQTNNGGGINTGYIHGHHGGLGFIHGGTIRPSGSSYQYGGGTQHGQNQGFQGGLTVQGSQTGVIGSNHQSAGSTGINSNQISTQQNFQQGGMTSQGQSNGFSATSEGINYAYQRPQGIIYEVHWTQPGGYGNAGGASTVGTSSGGYGNTGGASTIGTSSGGYGDGGGASTVGTSSGGYGNTGGASTVGIFSGGYGNTGGASTVGTSSEGYGNTGGTSTVGTFSGGYGNTGGASTIGTSSGGYGNTGGASTVGTFSGQTLQSQQGNTGVTSSTINNQNTNGHMNLYQGNQVQGAYSGNQGSNQLSQTSQNINQGSLSTGGGTQTEQVLLTNNSNNFNQSQGGNQQSNSANVNYIGSVSASPGNNIYGTGAVQSQGSSGQYNTASGQYLGANIGFSGGSTSNTGTTTQLQENSNQASNFANGAASGSYTYGAGSLQAQGNSGQSYGTGSGSYSGTNSGQFNSMGNGYYSGTGSTGNALYGMGTASQTQGGNGQYYNTAAGIQGGTNLGSSSGYSMNSNVQSQGNNEQGSNFVNGNYAGSTTGYLGSSNYGSGTQQSQGISSQLQNSASGHYTGINTGSSGSALYNIGPASQSQGNGGQSSTVSGYYTGTNSGSTYGSNSMSQTQASSNQLLNTASENYVSSTSGASGNSAYGSSTHSQSQVSNTAGSSASAVGGGSQSSTNSYGGSFQITSNNGEPVNNYGQEQPSYSQPNVGINNQPGVHYLQSGPSSGSYGTNNYNSNSQTGGSLNFEGNINIVGPQKNKNHDLGLNTIHTFVYADEPVESDTGSVNGGTGSSVSGTISGGGSNNLIHTNADVSGDKSSQVSGNLNSGTSVSQNHGVSNSVGVGSGIYHVGSGTTNLEHLSGTHGSYSSSSTSLNQTSDGSSSQNNQPQSSNHGSNVQFGGSGSQQAAQFGHSSQSSGSHESGGGFGGSSSHKESAVIHGTPSYQGNLGTSSMASSNKTPSAVINTEETSGTSDSGSHHSLSLNSGGGSGAHQSTSGSSGFNSGADASNTHTASGGSGLSSTSNLSGGSLASSNIMGNYGTNINSQPSGSGFIGSSVQNNKDWNNTSSFGTVGNQENFGNEAYGNSGSTNTGSLGSNSQISLMSETENTEINGLNSNSNSNNNLESSSLHNTGDFNSHNSDHHSTSGYTNNEGTGSVSGSAIVGSNNVKPSQSTSIAYTDQSNSLTSQMSGNTLQNYNVGNSGNYNYNINNGPPSSGVSGTIVQSSRPSNELSKPNNEHSAALTSESNTNLGISGSQPSNSVGTVSSEISGNYGGQMNVNHGGGNSQVSGTYGSNSQHIGSEVSGSGIYDNQGNLEVSNKPGTLSSAEHNVHSTGSANHGTFSSSQMSGTTLFGNSGISASQSHQGAGSVEEQMVLNSNGQYMGTVGNVNKEEVPNHSVESSSNSFEQIHTSNPSYEGSSNVEVANSVHKEQNLVGGSSGYQNLNQPTATAEIHGSSIDNGHLGSSSSSNYEGSGSQSTTGTTNNLGSYGSAGSLAGGNVQMTSSASNNLHGSLMSSGNLETASSLHSQGGIGALVHKQSQGSLHLSHYSNPYTDRYIYVPEIITYNVDTSRVGSHETENVPNNGYTSTQTGDGSYFISNSAPLMESSQMFKNPEAEIIQSYYIHEQFPNGPHIDQMTSAVLPGPLVGNSYVPHAQALVGTIGNNQYNAGVTGDISGHLGKLGNFQGLLNVPNRIVGVLSGVGNSLGGFINHGIGGGFQGNAEHSGEVHFEGGFSNYPGVSGSVHGNFENHLSGSLEGSAEKRFAKRKLDPKAGLPVECE